MNYLLEINLPSSGPEDGCSLLTYLCMAQSSAVQDGCQRKQTAEEHYFFWGVYWKFDPKSFL